MEKARNNHKNFLIRSAFLQTHMSLIRFQTTVFINMLFEKLAFIHDIIKHYLEGSLWHNTFYFVHLYFCFSAIKYLFFFAYFIFKNKNYTYFFIVFFHCGCFYIYTRLLFNVFYFMYIILGRCFVFKLWYSFSCLLWTRAKTALKNVTHWILSKLESK